MNELPTEILGLSTEIIAQGHIEFTENSLSYPGNFCTWNEICNNISTITQYPLPGVVILISSY